jgi:DNA-binding NarL/FixJ family response regulator
MGTDEPLEIAVVDDHGTYRRGLRAELEADSGITIVGEYSTADDAVSAIPELRPDVTLMDLRIPRRKGQEATYCGADAIRDIRKVWPEAVFIVLTMYRDDERVREAIRAGVRGYLLKEDESIDFVQAIRLVAGGKGVFDRHVVNLLPSLVPPLDGIPKPFPELNNRQHEILALLVAGMSNGEIAKKLEIQKKTVENNLPLMYDKLQVKDRGGAIARARAAGLGLPGNGNIPTLVPGSAGGPACAG